MGQHVEHRGSKGNSGRRQGAGGAAGLPQQGGSFNKHELEPAAIESYHRKLTQTRADLMKKRKERKRRNEKRGGGD